MYVYNLGKGENIKKDNIAEWRRNIARSISCEKYFGKSYYHR